MKHDLFNNNNEHFALAECWTFRYGNSHSERKDFTESWEEYAYNLLPLCKSVTIPVLDAKGRKVETFDLAGPTAYSVNPVMYKFQGDVPESYANLGSELYNNLLETGITKMFPSHPNWIEVNGNMSEYRILTADDAYDFTSVSENYARGQLFYHMKPGKSRYFGRFICRIVEGGVLALHDGFSYARKSAFPMVPGTLWKAIGYKNLEGFIANQELVAKGIIRLLSDADFDWLRAEYNVADDVDIIIPQVTCKFYKQESRIEMDFYSLFRGIDRYEAKYSLKMFKTLPLKDKGLELGYSVFSKALDEIFAAIASNDRGKLISLMGKAYREYVESDEVCEGFNVDAAEITATMNCLLDLPMGDEEIVGKVLHVLLKNVRKVKARGMTGVACPGLDLHAFEIRVPRTFLKRFDRKVGDTVTLYRAPFTGIEAATVTIVGISEEGIEIDPVFWADRFSGDFDGDLAGILLDTDLIDEDHIGNAVSSKKKGKKAYGVVAATAKAWFSKLSISKMDTVITACLERGIDPTPARELMQAIIDMVKHEVELPEDMDAFILDLIGGPLSINAIHTILNLYRTDERKRQSIYNLKVEIMHRESSNIPLLAKLIPHFPLVLCKSKYIAPVYGETAKIHEHYMRLCRKHGYMDFAIPKDFNAPTFNPAVVKANLKVAAKMMATLAKEPKTIAIADAISAAYKDMVTHFRKGNITVAYEIMRRLVAKMDRSDHEAVGYAVKYMFLAIVNKSAKLHKGKDYGWYLKVIAYLPREIGSWNLRRASKFYGGTPVMNIAVVYPTK